MFWTDLIHPNSKYVLGLPACGVTMHVSRRSSLLRKEAGLKVQLHRTSPRTHHMSSNFQTNQKLNQKDSLRKQSGSKPQFHRTSPKTHHTSSNFHIKQKPNQGNSLGEEAGTKTQPHRIIGPLGLLTLRQPMDCAPPQQDNPQETHLW